MREVAEETGLRVAVVRLVGRVERAAPAGAIYVIDDFVCRVVGGTLVAGDDAMDAKWVTREQMAALPLAPGLYSTLAGWDVLPD
jgi:ADP-ribose pyrophosphatase YjhB (NUDIX family)